MSGLEAELSLLFSTMQGDMAVAYSTISATCLLLYEIVITFPDELRLIWRLPWSYISVLHVLIRYYAFGFLIVNTYAAIGPNLSIKFCGPFNPFQVWGVTALVPVVDILIIIRVYALYHKNIWIGAVLVFFWLVETGVIFYLTAKGFGPNTGAMPNPLPGVLLGCFFIEPFQGSSIAHTGGIAIACQGVYLGLALYKLARQMKTIRLLRSMTPLLRIFFRDGALYCFNILAMYALNVILYQYNKQGPIQGVGEPWLVVMVTITGGRLVLNLRKSVQTPDSSPTEVSYELQSTADNNGQFSSIIILDAHRTPDAPIGDPFLRLQP